MLCVALFPALSLVSVANIKQPQRHHTPVCLSNQHTTLPRFFMANLYDPEPYSTRYRGVELSRPVCFVQGWFALVVFGCGNSRLVHANKTGFGDGVRIALAQGGQDMHHTKKHGQVRPTG